MRPTHVTERHVLVLSYRFPPQGRVGAHRTTKFVRYLGQFGWKPIVHTVSNPYCTHYDETLGRQIPGDVPVYRTPTIEVEALEKRFRSTREITRRWRSRPPDPSPPSAVVGGSRTQGSRVRDHLWRHWLSPDPQIVWVPAALWRSRSILRRHRVAAIYSSSPPHSVQLLALALRRRFHLPWVVDMRDPWTEGLHRQQWYEGNERRRRREEGWEYAICREADHVLVATEGSRRLLQGKYPDVASKVTCITNGFDPRDFGHIDPAARNLDPRCLHVTLTGNVETAFDLMPLLRAIASVVRRRPEARRLLRFNFIGTRRRPECDSFLRQAELEEIVRWHAPVSHPECLQLLSESQVALIAAAERSREGIKISAKLFEYLYLRKPILALIERGVTTEILDRARLGFHAGPRDVGAIGARIETFLDQHARGRIEVEPDEAYVSGFDREQQTRRLASILDEISSGR